MLATPCSKATSPSVVHVYNGHMDLVRAVDFRTVRTGAAQSFQLVSWSKDQTLRLWRIDDETLQVRAYEFVSLPFSQIDTRSLAC